MPAFLGPLHRNGTFLVGINARFSFRARVECDETATLVQHLGAQDVTELGAEREQILLGGSSNKVRDVYFSALTVLAVSKTRNELDATIQRILAVCDIDKMPGIFDGIKTNEAVFMQSFGVLVEHLDVRGGEFAGKFFKHLLGEIIRQTPDKNVDIQNVILHSE